MDLAIASCERAFELSQETLTGKATHWIVGGPNGVPDQTVSLLRRQMGLQAVAPVMDGYVTVGHESFRLLGIDPLADSGFRSSWLGNAPTASSQPLSAALALPDTVALTASEASRLGTKLGGTLEVQGGPPLRVGAVLEGLPPNLEQALQGQLLCDVAVAQERLNSRGNLSRIEVILTPPQVSEVRKSLPAGLELIPSGTRSRVTEQMSVAFFLNLRALSLLSLLVGALLIYNVIHFLALQRRPWMAQLRILGVTSAELRGQLLAEAGWLGALGSTLGLALGAGLARVLLPLLTRTINDLYYNLQVQQVYLAPSVLLKGALLGWACALAAALLPALEAARAPAVSVLRRSELESHGARWAGKALAGGLLVLLLSWALLLGSHLLELSFVAMFGLILGSAAMLPGLVLRAQAALLRKLPPSRFLVGKLMLGGVERSLSRLGVALVAMTVALSAIISITLMVHSFRLSLKEWLGRTLSADLFIGRANRQAARAGQALDPAWVARLQGEAGVARLLPLKMTPIRYRLNGEVHPTQLVAQAYTQEDLSRLRLRQGRFFRPEARDELMASEPFLRSQHVSVGSELEMDTAEGPRPFRLVGAFQDYASDSGYLVSTLDTYRTWFHDSTLSGVSVFLEPGRDPEDLRRRILSWPESQGLEIRSQRALRELSLEIFEQTFQVTRALQILAVLVATAGTLGAVAANRLERRREFALWGCLGLTRRERWGVAWGEAALCGFWAGVWAWPCGLLQAYAMVHFINQRAFGWTLDFFIDPLTLLFTPVLGVLAASLAVLLTGPPGSSRLAEDLRQE